MIKKLLILIIPVIFITGCSYDEYEMPDDAYINTNKTKFKVYDEGKLYDLIGSNNVNILSKDEDLDLNEIGTFTKTIEYEYKNRKYKYDIKYDVIDDTPPFIISAPKYRTILLLNATDFCDEVNMADNYDAEPQCRIDGDYDITKEGTYNVSLVAYDSSNNETKRDLTINVVSSFKNSSNGSSSNNQSSVIVKPFSEMYSKYKTDDNELGIDVSRWQGDIDFHAVKASGATFVMMRMGVNNAPDDDTEEDSKFRQNIKNAKEAGLKVGVYIYTTSTSIDKSIEQAKWALNELNGETLDFPIAYDFESWKSFRTYKISLHTLNECFNQFRNTLRSSGYDAMLYGSKFYLNNMWDIKDDTKVWLAHYIDETDYDKNYMMWQFTNAGRIDGINGYVDIDILKK